MLIDEQPKRRLGMFLGVSDVELSGVFDEDLDAVARHEQPEGEALNTLLLVQIVRELKRIRRNSE